MIIVKTRRPRGSINWREFDTHVAILEGGKKNLPIAQVSEVRLITMTLLREMAKTDPEVVAAAIFGVEPLRSQSKRKRTLGKAIKEALLPKKRRKRNVRD